MTIKAPDKVTRVSSIDIARGIAIAVIILHHVSQYMVKYNVAHFDADVWSKIISNIINRIDVPLFMTMAGCMVGMSHRRNRGRISYFELVRKKLCRLMLPFIAVSSMHFLVKVFFPGWGLQKALAAFAQSFYAPRLGVAGHLWFLYCLMCVFIVWPLILRVGSRMYFVVLSLLFILAVLPFRWFDPFLDLKSLVWYLPIFGVGYYYGKKIIGSLKPALWMVVLTMAIFVTGVFVLYNFGRQEAFIPRMLINVAAMIMSISVAYSMFWISDIIDCRYRALGRPLSNIGYYSYDIYLLHVILVGHPLTFLLSKMHTNIVITYVLFVIIIFATLIIPIGFSKIIRRWPKVAFVMLGLPLKR